MYIAVRRKTKLIMTTKAMVKKLRGEEEKDKEEEGEAEKL